VFFSQHQSVRLPGLNAFMDTFGKRLRSARLAAGLTQAELANKAGFKHQSAIGNMESDLREGSRNTAVLASILHVNALWLETGKGVRADGITGMALQIARAFAQLPEDQQERLAPIIAAAIGASISDQSVENKMPITRARARQTQKR
jgi:transcriptional regulator with XRE-family HTH domain